MARIDQGTPPSPMPRLGEGKSTKVEEIARHIKNEILLGRMRPGNRLSERSLSTTLSVGRGTIRESLVRLARDGFIENVRGAGAFVKEYSIAETELMFYLREILEGAAARFAAERINKIQAAELRQIIAEMEAAGQVNDGVRFNDADALFHLRIAEIAGSKVLESFIVNQLDLKTMIIGSPDLASSEIVVAGHRAIADSIIAGYLDLAEQMMRSHIRQASMDNLAWMKEQSARAKAEAAESES